MPLEAYLASRRFNAYLYNATLDHDSMCLTVPLWNLSGQRVGFQQHKPLASAMQRVDPKEAKYYTRLRRSDAKGKAWLTAFGLELLDPKQRVVFLAEGMFDVCPLHNRGVNALATLCNNPKHLKSWLRSMNYVYVALAEGDKAGKKLASMGDFVEYLPEGKDPGDMPEEWFDALVEKYS